MSCGDRMKTKKIELSGFIDYKFWQSEDTYSINLFKKHAYDGLTKCTITLEVPVEEKVYKITESEFDDICNELKDCNNEVSVPDIRSALFGSEE